MTAVEHGATLSATAGPVQAYDAQRCHNRHQGGGVRLENHIEMQHCVAPSGALTGSRPLKVRLHPLRCTGVGPYSQHHAQSFSETQREEQH